jgi:arylsulfatase A-like enzyme
MTDDEVALLVDLYDEEIRFTDAGIGRLLNHLRELGLYDDTLIVLTADHGEEFLEHGWIGHTQNLYEAVVRVPLIICEPGLPHGPRVVAKPVSLVSLVATILELAGVDSSQRSLHEPSLVRELRGERDETSSVVFMEVDFQGYSRKKTAFKKAIVVGDLKLIRDDLTGAMEIYDLAADPQERNDLAERHPELREKLVPLLERSVRRSGSAPVDALEVEFSSEEIEELRALGYVEP